MEVKLGSIEEEAAACRKAFENVAVGSLVVHCHHGSLFEYLEEPAENRISYILSSKPQHEQALRLHLFRPVNSKLSPKKWRKADAKRLHIRICKGCPWDEDTIFPTDFHLQWVIAGDGMSHTITLQYKKGGGGK